MKALVRILGDLSIRWTTTGSSQGPCHQQLAANHVKGIKKQKHYIYINMHVYIISPCRAICNRFWLIIKHRKFKHIKYKCNIYIYIIFWHIWAINIQSVGRTKTSTKYHEITNVSSCGIIEHQIYLWLANQRLSRSTWNHGRALLPASRGCGSKAMENYQHWYNLIIYNLYRHREPQLEWIVESKRQASGSCLLWGVNTFGKT